MTVTEGVCTKVPLAGARPENPPARKSPDNAVPKKPSRTSKYYKAVSGQGFGTVPSPRTPREASLGGRGLHAMGAKILEFTSGPWSTTRAATTSHPLHPRELRRQSRCLITGDDSFRTATLDNASRHAGHRDGRVVAGTPRREIGHVQHAVGRVQVVVHRATRTDSQKRRDLAAVEIDPGRIAVVARGQQMRARPRARTSPADPLQRFADQFGRWKVVNVQGFIVPGEQLAARQSIPAAPSSANRRP